MSNHTIKRNSICTSGLREITQGRINSEVAEEGVFNSWTVENFAG